MSDMNDADIPRRDQHPTDRTWSYHQVTPLTIIIMLECFKSGEPGANLPEKIWNSEAAEMARVALRECGLIDDYTNRSTARGDAWVKFICETPLPVKQWVLPSTSAGRE